MWHPKPDAYLASAAEDLELLLTAIADWAEGDPAIRPPDALGHRAANSLHSIRFALRDARLHPLHGRDGRELAPLGVVEIDPSIVANVAAAADELEAMAYDRRHPTVASATDEYRQYWECPSDALLAEAATLLHRMFDHPSDPDTEHLASRLQQVSPCGDIDIALTVLDDADEATHRRIIERLATESDEPPPIVFGHPTHGDGDG